MTPSRPPCPAARPIERARGNPIWLLAALVLALPLTLAYGLLPADAAETTVKAEADSYVESSNPRGNHASERSLWIDGSPLTHGYVRFDVGPRKPTKAILRLHIIRSSEPFEVRAASARWREKTITFANAPSAGSVAISSGPVVRGRWAEIDVTPLVTSGGPVTLVLNGVSSKSQAVSSRESGSRYTPRLVLNRDSATTEPDAAPAIPRSGTGQAYYVDSRRGNDNNAGRSHTEPFRSLVKVNSLPLNPGDQLLLARGSRWSETLSPIGSGSSTDAITIGAYGSGAAPTVTGGSTCIRVNGSHVIIQDLQVTNCSWAGIQVAGRANTIQRNRVTDTAAGIHVRQGAVGNAVLSNELVDNKRMSVNTPSPSWDDSGAFGILVNGDHTDVGGNLIVGHDAFSYDYSRDGAAVEIYNGVGNHIHHNVAVDNDTFTELGGSRSANNTVAYNEVRSSLSTSTFLVTRGRASNFGPVRGTKVINNTAHLTGRLSQGFVCYDGCSPDILTMRNNILSARWKAGYADAAFDDAFNIYYGGITQFPLGSTSRVADPMFRDPANGDLRLRAQSPAVDSGTSNAYSFDVGGLPQRVAAVTDRGAHERQ